MRRSAIDVEVVLLNILAMVGLAVRQAKHAFLQNRVATIPQRHREAKLLLVVRDSRYPILAPTVGARSCLIMGEVVPGVAVFTVVFANGAPLSLTKVRSPFLPWNTLLTSSIQPFLFGYFNIVQWEAYGPIPLVFSLCEPSGSDDLLTLLISPESDLCPISHADT